MKKIRTFLLATRNLNNNKLKHRQKQLSEDNLMKNSLIVIMSYQVLKLVVFFPTLIFASGNETVLLQKCVNSALRGLENTNGNVTHILYRDETINRNFLKDIIGQINQTVLISDKILNFSNTLYRLISSGYVIFTTSLNNLQKLFDRIDVTHYNWYPRSRFVVIFVEPVSTREQRVIAERIVLILREYDINDLLLLISSPHGVKAYTWFPFSARNECRTGVHVTLIDQCTDTRSKFIKNLYPAKIPWQFHGCVFTMAGFHWPPYVYVDNITKNFTAGYNILMMRLMAEKHNLTLKHIIPPEGSRWGSQLDNGSWTGGLGLLERSEAEVSLGGSLQTMMRINRFDFSVTYTSVYMKFYLVLPSKLPHWKNMIDIFSPEFWTTILAVYLMTSFIMGFVSKLNKNIEKAYYRRFSNCFLTMWGIAMGHSANCIPTSQAVRTVFLIWLIYNFHITLVYTSSLLSFITKPAYEDPIRTLQQLSKTDLKIIMVKQFVQISSKMDNDFRALLASKSDPHVDHVETIEQLLEKKNLVVLDTADHFEIFAKDKLSKVYSLDDFVRLNPCLYLKKGSVFLKYVDDIQLHINENGMFHKLEEDYRELNKHEKLASRNYDIDDQMQPLMLQELSGSFYVLLFGLCLSTLVFFAELISYKTNKNKK